MYRIKSFIIIFTFVSIMLYLHNQSAHHHVDGHHQQIVIPHHEIPPAITGSIEQDHNGFWYVQLETKNFTFAPEKAGEINQDDYNEGHAHLYINYTKVDSLFEPFYRLGYLPAGTYHIKISLNGHNHEIFIHDGKEIAFESTLIVKEE